MVPAIRFSDVSQNENNRKFFRNLRVCECPSLKRHYKSTVTPCVEGKILFYKNWSGRWVWWHHLNIMVWVWNQLLLREHVSCPTTTNVLHRISNTCVYIPVWGESWVFLACCRHHASYLFERDSNSRFITFEKSGILREGLSTFLSAGQQYGTL